MALMNVFTHITKLNEKPKQSFGELTQEIKSKPFHKVLLFINKTAQIITSGKVFEKTGNRITYSLSGMNGNATVTDATFAYDAKKYPGIEVVDLR